MRAHGRHNHKHTQRISVFTQSQFGHIITETLEPARTSRTLARPTRHAHNDAVSGALFKSRAIINRLLYAHLSSVPARCPSLAAHSLGCAVDCARAQNREHFDRHFRRAVPPDNALVRFGSDAQRRAVPTRVGHACRTCASCIIHCITHVVLLI